jgi:acyl-CoA thioester hydrolase
MADDDALPDPARVRIRRRIEWMDTDAGGIWHWTTVFRLAEAAEAALHAALGIPPTETFGVCPRVAVSATFSKSLRFDDAVEAELAVESMGRSSLAYRLDVFSDGEPAAEGSVTVVFVDRATRKAVPWPPEIREKLAGGGLVEEPPR